MKPDQERVKNLLTDTVTLLCKNGLTFSDELRVEGLIGITLDNNDVFLVNINERFGLGGDVSNKDTSDVTEPQRVETDSRRERDSPHTPKSQGSHRPNRPVQNSKESDHDRHSLPSPKTAPNRTSQNQPSPAPTLDHVKIKQEKQDVIILDPKTEANFDSCSIKRNLGNSFSEHSSPSQRQSEWNTDTRDSTGQQYSSGLDSYGHDESIDGEPPSKRRTMGSETGDDSESGGDSFGAYITGIVRNVHEKPPDGSLQDTTDSTQPTSWPSLNASLNLSSEIAAQMAQAAMAQGDNSLAGLDTSMPGCSSWPGTPGSIGGTPGSGQSADMEPSMMHCHLCQHSFATHSSLRRHERTVHGGARNYVCDYCNARFSQRFNKDRHVARVHGQIMSNENNNSEPDTSALHVTTFP